MIFSVDGSIQKIIDGSKTRTRRPTDRYQVGKTYAIQPGRTQKGIPDGRILIVEKREETGRLNSLSLYDCESAYAEGGYTPEEYETLYEKMYPNWTVRYDYGIKFVPNEENSDA